MTNKTAKVVLITGAGSGFGKGTSVALATRGHKVIATTETEAQAELCEQSILNYKLRN